MGHSAQFTVETEPWDSRTVNLIGEGRMWACT